MMPGATDARRRRRVRNWTTPLTWRNIITSTAEQVLLRLRTRPKVLFVPAVMQVLLVAAQVATYQLFPEDTGIAWVQEWGQFTVHGNIVLIELSYVLVPALRWREAGFTVTNRRLVETWGILYRHSREIPLDRIASVTPERGLLDRIFGCGTVIFHDATLVYPGAGGRFRLSRRAGAGRVGIRFHDAPNVTQVIGLVDRVRYSKQ